MILSKPIEIKVFFKLTYQTPLKYIKKIINQINKLQNYVKQTLYLITNQIAFKKLT